MSIPSSFVVMPDVVMPIVAINDSTIQINGITLTYADSVHYTSTAGKPNDTANNLYYWNVRGTLPWTDEHFRFYRATDLAFFSIQNMTSGAQWGDAFATKIVH